MANSHSIHLVRPQRAPPKTSTLDPASITAEVLAIVRECTKALQDAEEYTEWALGQCRGNLNQLAVTALRAMARKASPTVGPNTEGNGCWDPSEEGPRCCRHRRRSRRLYGRE